MATPPQFRPPQFAAAVEAGKHVFMEKPLAADPVGCRMVMDAATRADELDLSVVVGTQRHHQASYVECRQRILDGAIGDILSARAYWCGGPLGGWDRTDRPTDLASQIRSWFHWAWLSGDHIVEQHVHNLDVCNWFLGKHPVSAYGLGYRARKTYGDSYDFFAVDYEYEGRVHMSSLCRQVADCDNNVSEWLVGTEGIANCGGQIWDHDGNEVWRHQGEAPSPYVQEHTDLVNAIRTGERVNEAHGVAESTMTAIMGRMSAYTGKAVTWDQVMASDLSMGPDEYDLEADFDGGPVPVPGVPQ
jgi:myo-inositol 2-dehydrogenase/D-chiro-inositol 1-dehydrogenase